MIVALLFSVVSLSARLSLCHGADTAAVYPDHSVIRCSPDTSAQSDLLHAMDEAGSLDFWKEPTRRGGFVDVMVSSADRAPFEQRMKAEHIPCREMIADVQALIDEQKKEASLRTTGGKAGSYFDSYHPPAEVYAYMDSLAVEFPSLASVSSIGTTTDGQDMRIIHLSTNQSQGKPTLWFDGGLHAREWITTPTVTFIADSLLRGYGSDQPLTALLDAFDVIVCPIINVDGVDYTWADDGDRMWRKTRSANSGSQCVGTDPCRNFAYEWAGEGASPMACSDTYYGPSAASEPEVQAVQSYVCDHSDTITLYINFHSYSQLWLSPWGYTGDLPADYTQQDDGSAAAVAALEAVHGTKYEYGATSDTIYPASGIASDYAYGACGVKYSYTVELRDTGRYGFMLPPDQIIPTGEETLAGVMALANFILANP